MGDDYEEMAFEDTAEDVVEEVPAVEAKPPPPPESKGEGKNSLILMCLGCLIFPACLILLGWNEKTTLCEAKALMEAEQESVLADCDDADAVEGQFVFFSCPIQNEGLQEFTPTSFNVPGLKELIKFKSVAGSQKIEMYQCIETKEEREIEDDSWLPSSFLGETGRRLANTSSFMELASDTFTGETRRRRTGVEQSSTITTYRYGMAWTDVHYDSTTFKGTPENIKASGCPDFIYNGKTNHNPEAPDRGDGEKAPLGRQVAHATSVKAGAFTFVDDFWMQTFDSNHTMTLAPWKDSFGLPATTDNILATITPDALAVHPDSDEYLSSCAHDRLGCVRVSYNSSLASHISVMGKVGSSGNMEPYTMDNSWGCGGDFIRMYPEEMTKDDFIAKMKGESQARTWVLRVLGLTFCWLSVWCCLEPIASAAGAVGNLLSNIPILGDALASLLEGVVDFIVCFMACGWGCCCGLLVIAIVWISMRPVVGGPLMGGCLVLFVSAVLARQLSPRDPKRMRKRRLMQGYGATDEGEGMMYA